MTVTIHSAPASDLTEAEIARWAPVPAAVAIDMGAGQIDPALRPLRPAGTQPRLFGRAVTVLCQPPDFGAVLHALDEMQAGQVLVIDAVGHRDNAMIGDILSGHLRRKGIAGVVCDGAIRDAGTLGQWADFPVFSRWITPRGPVGAALGAINLAVTVGGCKVTPGDLVIGDDDGLAVLTPAMIRSLITAAEAKLTREVEWTEALTAGQPATKVFGLSAALRL